MRFPGELTLKRAARLVLGRLGYVALRKTTYEDLRSASEAGTALEQAKEFLKGKELPFRDHLFMDEYVKWEAATPAGHSAGAFPSDVLRRIENILPPTVSSSVETGCGKSTTMFSNISDSHLVFCLDDRGEQGSSFDFFASHPLTRMDRIEVVFGPTQRTIYGAQHRTYDVVLIDGPHGYPFPELEYVALYPHIRHGGLLIVDDVHIPSIGRFADFLADDEMFELVALVQTTAIFRRTDAPTFDPTGDGWWTQGYNRRRVAPDNPYRIARGSAAVDAFTEINRERMRGS